MAEFSVPFSLVTPAGTITFNGTGDGFYLSDIVGLDQSTIRNAVDPLPQTDGSLVHRFFRTGKSCTLRGYILANAGTTTRRGYEDTLRGYLDRLIRPTQTELEAGLCRLKWTPSGYSDDRMIDRVRLLEPVHITGGYLKEFEFTLTCPYPYAIDATQQSFTGSGTATNSGNTPVYPVIRLNSTFTGATVANTTTGESVVFSSGIASGYAEVVNFDKTVYQNGSGANLLSKLDFSQTTFFALAPGANAITFSFTGSSGASGTIYFNNAWA